MADNAEILAKIIEGFHQGMEGSRRAKNIAEKIAQGKATYADAYSYARENSRILRNSIQENISDALTEDGRLFREAADVVIRQPMQQSGKRVIETAAEIQQQLNEEAGIGIRAIEPGLNEDQIDGIITGICNAESYDAGENTLYSQIENFLEGTVDDCVHDNADFQYRAGLNPKIERRAAGKCCEWCDRLAGTYDYEDVRDRGNDVFRRHKNCHCVVSYIPGGKSNRRQNVHSRQWTEETENGKISRKRLTQDINDGRILRASMETTDLRNEYFARSVGAKSVNYDVMDLRTGEQFHFAEDTILRNKKVFAGKGSKTVYRNAYKYAETIGGNAADWQHVKAIGTIDYYGERRDAEVHWSQCEGYGKHDFFIKEWKD